MLTQEWKTRHSAETQLVAYVTMCIQYSKKATNGKKRAKLRKFTGTLGTGDQLFVARMLRDKSADEIEEGREDGNSKSNQTTRQAGREATH